MAFLTLFNRRGGSFSPDDLTGLVATVLPAESQAAGLLWQDTAKTIAATADGDPVRVAVCPFTAVEWTAGSDAKRPLLYEEGGGKWSLSFDGVDDELVSAGLSGGDSPSLYFSARPLVAATMGLFDSAPGLATVIRQWPNGRWTWFATNPDITLGWTDDTWVRLSLLHDLVPSREIVYRRNGAAVGTYTDPSTDAAGWQNTTVGSINGGSVGVYSGRVAAVLLYSPTHTAAEWTRVEAYLAALTP